MFLESISKTGEEIKLKGRNRDECARGKKDMRLVDEDKIRKGRINFTENRGKVVPQQEEKERLWPR